MFAGNRIATLARLSFALCVLTPWLAGTAQAGDEAGLQLRSSTFQNNAFLPISMIYNAVPSGQTANACSIDGSIGLDQSPELSWWGAPIQTASFVIVMYDTTAAFTHWAMYNISPRAQGLPANAGVAGSPYGAQIVNDFFDPNYDGPCPPPATPDVHQYVVTLYALNEELDLPQSANFPANAETLYRALLRAGRNGHIIDAATLTGYYSIVTSTVP